MANCCDISNPLIRDGVSQPQRQMAALLPDSVKVDERDLADFLVFAYRLSQQIIYYKANGQPDDNEPDGNWQDFFKSSVPVQLALIGKTRPQVVRDTYNRQLETFLGDCTPNNLAPVLLTWSRVFDQIRSWRINLESYPPFLSIIRGLVRSNLREPLLRLRAFEQSYITAQDDLNRMTQLHLNFFYREILRFPEKSVQPDRAHLLFELAKFQQEYRLSSGTAFNAGKDASGVDLIYKLNKDIIVHTAQIASRKGLFLASRTTTQGKQLTGLYASPIANSTDGKGGEFPKDQVVEAWKPFGDETRSPATVGLAIASDIFYLQEGSRIIVLTLIHNVRRRFQR